MASITINASEAVFIDESSATTNWEGVAAQLDVGEFNAGSEKRRSLIRFSLSAIPSGSIINSVTFKINNQGTDLTDNARTMYVNRMKRNWVENQVTWNQYSSGNNWATAGGGTNSADVELSAIGSGSVTNPPTAGYMNITLTASAIQEWLDGTFANNGIMLSMGTENNDMQRFDGEDAANPPQLVIDYTAPASFFIMF